MLIEPDFQDVKDVIVAGTYSVRVIGGVLDTWPKSGVKYVNWTLETCGEVDAKNNGRRLFHKTNISGGGAFRLAEIYSAAMGSVLPTGQGFDTEELLGREVKAIVVPGVHYQTGEPTGFPEIKKIHAL